MVRVGIVGGTGYTGVELLRLLAQHPHAEIVAITSRAEAGLPVAQLFPSLRGSVDLKFSDPKTAPLSGCDVAFFATPHGVAMERTRSFSGRRKGNRLGGRLQAQRPCRVRAVVRHTTHLQRSVIAGGLWST